MQLRTKLLILMLGALLATACSKEEAKSDMDAAMDKATQAVEDTADATGDMMDEAGEMAEETMDEAGDMAEHAMDEAEATMDDMTDGD